MNLYYPQSALVYSEWLYVPARIALPGCFRPVFLAGGEGEEAAAAAANLLTGEWWEAHSAGGPNRRGSIEEYCCTLD